MNNKHLPQKCPKGSGLASTEMPRKNHAGCGLMKQRLRTLPREPTNLTGLVKNVQKFCRNVDENGMTQSVTMFVIMFELLCCKVLCYVRVTLYHPKGTTLKRKNENSTISKCFIFCSFKIYFLILSNLKENNVVLRFKLKDN